MTDNEKKEPERPFLNTAEAAAWLRLTRNTLEKMRVQGTGPLYRKHGRYVRYHIEDLVDYVASQQAEVDLRCELTVFHCVRN